MVCVCVCLCVNSGVCVCVRFCIKKYAFFFVCLYKLLETLQSFNETSLTDYSGRSVHNMYQQFCAVKYRVSVQYPYQHNTVMTVPFNSKVLCMCLLVCK